MEATQHGESTTVDLGGLLDAGDGAMVTLEAGDTRLAAHRAVLSARSPVFAAMFANDTQEARTGSFIFPGMEGRVLRLLLAFLYTLQVPQLSDVAPQLLAAADKYGVSVLKAACEKQVAAQLSLETAAAAAVLAVRHSCDSLTRAAVAFIKSHLVEVVTTQGWADAVSKHHNEIDQLRRLLFETSTQPPVASGTRPPPTTQPPSVRSRSRSPAPSTSHRTPPPDDAAASRLRTQPPVASGTRPPPTAQPPSVRSRSRSPAPSTSHRTPPPDDAAASSLRSLPLLTRNRRLITAAKEGVVEQLEALLAAGATVTARAKGKKTALHWAAEGGHEEAARRLLAAGAAVDARDVRLWTPLHCAARRGHAAVVQLLLAAGADHMARTSGSWTALDLARTSNVQQVVDLLQGRRQPHSH